MFSRYSIDVDHICRRHPNSKHFVDESDFMNIVGGAKTAFENKEKFTLRVSDLSWHCRFPRAGENPPTAGDESSSSGPLEELLFMGEGKTALDRMLVCIQIKSSFWEWLPC